MKAKVLITRLNDGKIHSGQSLATEFGVSRTAIWKIVRRALKEGFNIHTVRGHGYQLASPVDFLDQEIIVKNVGFSTVYRKQRGVKWLPFADLF